MKAIFKISLILTFLLIMPDHCSAAILLSDCQMRLNVESLFMTGASTELILDGQTYQSGTISAVLDSSYTSNIEWDFGNGSVYEEYHLLFDCPLFAQLEIPAQKFHLIETGGAGTLVTSPSEIGELGWTEITINFMNDLVGQGAFDDGQYFSRWIYDNCLIRNNVTVNVNVNVNVNTKDVQPQIPVKIDGKAKDVRIRKTQDGTTIDIGDLDGTVTIPEPMTVLFLSLGGLLLRKK
jgi:hypothetical protein